MNMYLKAYKLLISIFILSMFTGCSNKKDLQEAIATKQYAKAVAANKPKTRYAAGSGAKAVLFLRSILSDRMFDELMLSQMK